MWGPLGLDRIEWFILYYFILPACELSKHGARIIRKGNNIIQHVSVHVVFLQSSLYYS